MNLEFNKLRQKYEKIIYKNYDIVEDENNIVITYCFEIPSLVVFNPKISFSKKLIINQNYNMDLFRKMVFHIGMIELISYYKCCCPKKVVIEAGYLNADECCWFKKLFYNGLGEFFYKNNIVVSLDELFEFEILGSDIEINNINYCGSGNLIPVGGGKDSIVSLELLSKYSDNKCFVINPKGANIECCYAGGYLEQDICVVKRCLDRKIVELNNRGFLNGHTPFSALVAFLSYLIAYLSNKKYIVLSNENSANEATVIGTGVNHQYSKSLEFENDFCLFTKNAYGIDIEYFSLLRPLKEIQIAKLFSRYKKYHKVFKSCNLGSKGDIWDWCCNCPKCLFVYIMLSAFLSKNEVIEIFGKDLLDDPNLEEYFIELLGKTGVKPFECVGTISEVIYAMNMIIDKGDDYSYLTKLYVDKYKTDSILDIHELDNNHNVIDEYLEILKENIYEE